MSFWIARLIGFPRTFRSAKRLSVVAVTVMTPTIVDIDDNNHISNVNIDDNNQTSMMMKMLIGLAVGDVAGIKIHHGTKHKLGLGGRVMPSQSITDSSEFSYCSC